MNTCMKDFAGLIVIDQALDIVRDLQPAAMRIGYYLALAGGTLNKGHSYNDVDIIAIPREGAIGGREGDNLITYFNEKLTQTRPPSLNTRGRAINVYHYSYKEVELDIAVVRCSLILGQTHG